MRIIVAIGLLGVLASPSGATQLFSNGPARTALVELFTSEGCNSCPPADDWLRSLRSKPGLWRDFVPVEYHVNYWDSIGWKDRFSTPEITEHEYAYATQWGCTPYTPCFARNGVQWKPSWGVVNAPGAPMGILSVEVGDDGICKVEFRPGPAARVPDDGSYEVHVAILGDGLFSQITNGENSGKMLEHSFVVLGIASRVMTQAGRQSPHLASIALPHPALAEGTRHAMAAWVTLHGDLEPIQATGGWLR